MSGQVSSFIDAVNPDLLVFNRGIEREALRVTDSGQLAMSPHPEPLGSKLTHPKITTDFSESQLELITPVHRTPRDALADLETTHRYVYHHLGDELLWPASMPCRLQNDASIPLAGYGESNLGRLKTTYRSGLGYRYGRSMQTICAMHYNFSFSDALLDWLQQHEQSAEPARVFRTRRYFDLMRNFRRYSWLLIYLFGASPAVCNSFVRGKPHALAAFDEDTAFLPAATSLRSGNLGYQSDVQAENITICYNSLEHYVRALATAICTDYAPYRKIGACVGGEYRQVNTGILQSEAEFYAAIRAKRVTAPGENFLACLLEQGVQYVEVRLLDVNPYLPLGIDDSEIRFLDSFLLYCLVKDSPKHDALLCGQVHANSTATICEGRAETLLLRDGDRPRLLRDWGLELLAGIRPLAALLDAQSKDGGYTASLALQVERLHDPARTPSGAVLADMRRAQTSFFRFALDRALAHRDFFTARGLTGDERARHDELARVSIRDRAATEAGDNLTFDEYLNRIAGGYLPLATT